MTRQRAAVVFLLVATVQLSKPGRADSGWGYEGATGPSTWFQSYPDCGGVYQSPVDINTDFVAYSDPARPVWIDYNPIPSQMNLTNNGHTLSITSSGTHPRLWFGPGQEYELVGVHFHWGKDSTRGSEHTIDGIRYPMEMHAVHRRAVGGVLVEPPEIVVVAVLFQISLIQNYGIARFIDGAPKVRLAETTVPIPPFAWSRLLPQFQGGYYYYRGSLTTPPCSEVVTFLLYDTSVKVQERQMQGFRSLRNDHGQELSGNFRPVQPLNGRQIYYVGR